MKLSEVIGRLLAYESRKATTSPPKKKKNLALKTSKVEKEEDDLDEDGEDGSSSAGESEEPKEPSEDDAIAPVPVGLEDALQGLKIKGDGNTDQEASDGGRIFRASSGIGVQDGGEESRVGDTLVIDGTAYGKAGIIPKVVDT